MNYLPVVIFLIIIIGVIFFGAKADKCPIGSDKRRGYIIVVIILLIALIIPFIMISILQ